MGKKFDYSSTRSDLVGVEMVLVDLPNFFLGIGVRLKVAKSQQSNNHPWKGPWVHDGKSMTENGGLKGVLQR